MLGPQGGSKKDSWQNFIQSKLNRKELFKKPSFTISETNERRALQHIADEQSESVEDSEELSGLSSDKKSPTKRKSLIE